MATASTGTEAKPPIAKVMFVLESGDIEAYSADEIRAAPDAFRAIMAEHKVEGRRPLVMRANRVSA